MHRLSNVDISFENNIVAVIDFGTPKQSWIKIHILVIYIIRASNALFFCSFQFRKLILLGNIYLLDYLV